MPIKLELNPTIKIHQLCVWANNFQRLSRENLFKLACNIEQPATNINVRLCAIFVLQHRFELITKNNRNSNVLTNQEVEQLYKLMIDDDNFPILVNINAISVEEITHRKNQEDPIHKKAIKRALEENVAVLRTEAAKLIIDFGKHTKKFSEIREDFIQSIKEILANMVCEEDQIFLSAKRDSDGSEKITVSNYFKSFVEVLYFTDEKSARPFMDIFDIKETDFSHERRTKST